MLEGAARGVRNVSNSSCKGASEGCCCTLLLLLLLLLQGAAVGVACPLWSWPAGAAAGCCFKVLRLKVVCALWSWHVGAIAGCRCRVLLSEAAGGIIRAWRVAAKKRFMLTKHKF